VAQPPLHRRRVHGLEHVVGRRDQDLRGVQRR
jgi:hypothetical protein